MTHRPLTVQELEEMEKLRSNPSVDKLLSEVKRLKQQVRETEARLSSRLIHSLKQLEIDETVFNDIVVKLELHKDLDLLEYERASASQAREKAHHLGAIYKVAGELMKAKDSFDVAQSALKVGSSDAPDESEIQSMYNTIIAKREKLFSLVKEMKLKERFFQRENNDYGLAW